MKKTDVDYSIFHDQTLDRDQIKKAVSQDLQAAVVLLDAILTEDKLLDAITDMYWNRYLTLKDRMLAKEDAG